MSVPAQEVIEFTGRDRLVDGALAARDIAVAGALVRTAFDNDTCDAILALCERPCTTIWKQDNDHVH